MIKEIAARLFQKHRTLPFPLKDIKLPERYPGRPEVSFSALGEDEKKKLGELCPTGALKDDAGFSLDLGLCVFCGKCAAGFPETVKFSKDYSMSVSAKEDLILREAVERNSPVLRAEIEKIFGRSLKLRQVSAGGCNACEADCNVLGTPAFDLGRFGIQFVASPRHADGLLITGPVTRNMSLALKKTYDAVPEPKIVVAAGACAITGGIYSGHKETAGIPQEIKVDLFIPGCPPNPLTILDGLLRLIGRIK